MAYVSIYLNFAGETEAAFNHYKKVFGTEFMGQMMRFNSMPPQPGAPALSDEDGNKIMHVALPILGGRLLMGTDTLESMGHKLVAGNNFSISLNPDTREEADKLYEAMSEGSTEGIAPHDEFWGYWGHCKDRFGVNWMFNVMNAAPRQ